MLRQTIVQIDMFHGADPKRPDRLQFLGRLLGTTRAHRPVFDVRFGELGGPMMAANTGAGQHPKVKTANLSHRSHLHRHPQNPLCISVSRSVRLSRLET